MNSATDPIFRLNTKNPDAVISILDESLEINSDLRCDLISSISISEIALALFHKKQNKFLALEVFQNSEATNAGWMKEIRGKSLILKRNNFSSTNVEIVNEFSTIVPAALFQEEDAEKYFHFNFGKNDLLIETEKIAPYDAVNVFAYPSVMDEAINHLFERPHVRHQATVILQGIHLSLKKSSMKSLVIHVRQGYIDIVVTEARQLILINSFRYQVIEDLLYYVLFVCDRLQLNPETVPTILMGQVEKESAIYHSLYKYLKEISFATHPGFSEYSYVFDEIPDHFYFNLFSLPLCES